MLRPVKNTGYTLVELVVALTVLAVGVLGAAATAAPIARLIRWGGAASSSAALAGAQLEAMRAAGCAALANGDASRAGGFRLTWTVAPRGPLREVTVLVSFPTGTGTRTETYEALIACRL
jgi:prepilin-type N-terminal cleavage/methylation domain-containing protein